MLRPGSELDGRFRVIQNFAAAANSIALAEELTGGQKVWLVLLSLSASAAELAAGLEQQARFGLGVPGLARAVASGVDGGLAFAAFAAPASGSVAGALGSAWSLLRVATLARRIAAALGPLHDQGIAHGLVCAELVAEATQGDVLFGFGVAALATRFGAPGEASQLLPPQYRAPELRNALLPPTPASDMYALGELVRALLSPAETPGAERASASCQGATAVEGLLAQAMNAQPRARLADVRAFAAELERIAESTAMAPSSPPAFDGAGQTAPVVLGAVEQVSSSVATSAAEQTWSPAALDAAALSLEQAAWSPTADSPSTTSGAAEPELEHAPFEHAPSPSPPSPSPPLGFVPAPTYTAQSSSRANVITLVLVLSGFLLMIGGVIGATAFAIRHARPHAARHATTRHVPPSVVVPRPTIPGPGDDDPEPSLPPAAAPTKKHALAREAIKHAPLVPPGVGPSSFPEEARAALPVLGSEPIWGTRRAPLTWVLFGDLDCPHTRHIWRALEAAKTTFGDDLRIVFRHRPLHEHPYALQAARTLAGLARERGSSAFFAALHKIAQDDVGLTDERLQAHLSAAGYANLDLSELARVGERIVADDLELAGQFAVRSTPLSFMNGTSVEGERTPNELERLLLDERRATTWALAAGAAAKDLYVTRTRGNLIGVGEQGAARDCVPVSGSPARGPADALVTLVEFSDFECPYCKQAEPTLKALLARYPRDLRLVWKDYPLPQHKAARLLANFAADAGTRGSNAGFWTVHDGLFARAGAVDDGVLSELAGTAGLDGALLLIAARAGVHEAAIRADMALGERLGVNGTPTFFANGRRIQGALALDQFDALIRAELGSAQRIVLHGVARDKVYGLVCESDD
jgi:protein-disulfide isomerase